MTYQVTVMISKDVLLISCGKHKKTVPCKAKEMYVSERFIRLKQIAEKSGNNWYILSAKYGLLSPEQIIEPYDLRLSKCSAQYLKQWAGQVMKEISKYGKDTFFLIMADKEYAQFIVPLLANQGYMISSPFAKNTENDLIHYVKNERHINEAIKLYNHIQMLAENTGGIRQLNSCDGKMYWPKRGVYFFVDLNERSIISNGFPRIVRIGTHAVSKNSKTTLWHRIKTHKGTNTGGGNHRGSIFRLHVGNAIIEKKGLCCDTWGKGQSASKEVREKEQYIERMVSEYIGNLGIVVLEVDDLPSKTSMRAFVEKNSIALLSSINYSYNFPTLNWLGNYSTRLEIAYSGLWNINYVRDDYDNNLLCVFEKYANETVKNFKHRRKPQ